MAKQKATAVDKLKRSQLSPVNQLELMGGDVNLEDFTLQMRNKAGITLIESITEAEIERTIEGASTLTVTVEDSNTRDIQNSGRLGRKVDVNINGLWFTLVSVKKSHRSITLVFEEREVNVLRYYAKFIMASRDQSTRAEFVLRMIKEVKEIPMKWIIPELHVKTNPSDYSDTIGPDQILVSPSGVPTNSTTDGTTASVNRNPGINKNTSSLTVKTVIATPEQIGNANAILDQGISMGASRKVLVCGIMTVIDESVLINLVDDGRGPIGLFQQLSSQGWPATRNIAVDSEAFFRSAMNIDKNYPTISFNDLCQKVQNSGTPFAYGQYQTEAEKFVDAYGVAGSNATSPTGTATGQTSNNQLQQAAGSNQPAAALQGNYYTRGTLSQKGTSYILTKENSWECMQRLAQEVNWRCFCVSGTIYFLSEQWLFKSKPFMVISEDTPGVDWIDYDYDEGKKAATVNVSCHLSRWSAPPGSIIQIENMGIINGRWLVNDVSRSLYDTQGNITLKKPAPVLPEPTTLVNLPSGFTGPAEPAQPSGQRNGTLDVGPVTDIQQRIVNYANSQLGVPYQYGTENPGVNFDCSGLTQAAYNSVGLPIPRTAYTQYLEGPIVMGNLEPGDLVFFGHAPPSESNIHHVGIYIGNGNMIDAPHTGAVVRVDQNFQNTYPDYFAATRPWQLTNKNPRG